MNAVPPSMAQPFLRFFSTDLLKNMQKKENGYRELTAAEQYIIEHKGTEQPGSGKFNQHFESGIYACKRCGAGLYRSEAKFDAGCGWPSFDDEISGAVERRTDADGRRTEILCKNCGAHLGHVFVGEQLTQKNTRHCVNSLSLAFEPEPSKIQPGTAYFGGGCFWGMEYYFQRMTGVVRTAVGYMGGETANPTYEQVCSGGTGHIEILQVEFDKTRVQFEDLARLFFEIHDPTQVDRQGPDIGAQYKSVIFFADEKQEAASRNLIEILQGKGLTIATELRPAAEFWPAENYHQDYYEKTGSTPYCHAYTKRF